MITKKVGVIPSRPARALRLAPSHSSEGHIADISTVSHPLPILRTSASVWQDLERFLLPPHSSGPTSPCGTEKTPKQAEDVKVMELH